jgi:preprotein translocase subunit SecD
MNKYPRWKYVLIVFLLILAVIYALPNLYGEDPAVQVSPHTGVNLTDSTESMIKTALSKDNLRIKTIQKNENDLLIRFYDTDTQLQAQDLLRSQLGDNYTVALNLAPTTPAWLRALGANPMKLGLDLRGGVHFLLAIDIDSLLQRRMNGDMRGIGDELRSARIRYTHLSMTRDNMIVLNFKTSDDLEHALKIIATHFPDLDIAQKNTTDTHQLTLSMSPAALIKAQDYAVDQTTTILRNRINELGVAEPIVQRQGINRISVDLPGVQDSARAKQILGGTATLEFHLVDVDADAAAVQSSGVAPLGAKLYQYEGMPVLLNNRVVLSGSSITGAIASVGENGQPSVNIRLGGGGEALFYRLTGENVGKPLAIVYVETKMQHTVIDGKDTFITRKVERVINIATIQSALGNNFQITGLEQKEAQNLSLMLRAGALPAPISIIEESTIGPSLGKENIKMGVLSVEIGFMLIVAFMLMYYSLFGLFADIALFLNLIFMFAILSMINMTLTLAGIAGIVLTVGMAVDANVLIFERIREELRNGVSPHAAIKAGYERAFSTIVDSNLTTLIAAVALAGIGTGSIKGFAVVLIIGILTSMFTAITVTRAITQLIYGGRTITKLPIGI